MADRVLKQVVVKPKTKVKAKATARASAKQEGKGQAQSQPSTSAPEVNVLASAAAAETEEMATTQEREDAATAAVKEQSTGDLRRHVPAPLRRAIFHKAGFQCEYIDSKTKRRCSQRRLLEIDHVKPFALGS